MADEKIKVEKIKKQSETARVVSTQMKNIFGDSGTQRYNGYFFEEPNFEWRNERRVDNVEEMRRTDATIKGLLNALKAPILATTWRVESDDDKIKEFVENNIFCMRRSWRAFVSEALTYFDFGFAVFEKIFVIRDGQIVLADLSPRIQSSIQNFQTKEKTKGVTQWVRTDEDPASQESIPMEKLLVLTNDKEGDDLSGQSVLRAAYRHYKYVDVFERVEGIGAERHAVGTPIAYLPDSLGDTEKDKVEEMLSNYRSNEKSFMLIPWQKEQGEIEILTPGSNTYAQAIDKAITRHRKLMLMSVLANFLGLGTDSTGSFALSKDQSSFFLKHVEDKAVYFAEALTKQVLEPLVRLNFGEVDKASMPKLKFAPLGDIDFKEYSDVLKTLVDSGLVKVDGKLKQFVHNTFQVPELSEEDLEEMEDKELDEELAEMEQEVDVDEFDFVEDGFDDEGEDEESDEDDDEEEPDEPEDEEETEE